MQVSPQLILQKTAHFDSKLHSLRDYLWSEVERLAERPRARTQVTPRTSESKIAQAVMQNAVYGFKKGVEFSPVFGIFGAPPTWPLDLRGVHLPTRIGRFFGPVGVLSAGRLLLGINAPVSDLTGRPRIINHEGLTGLLIHELNNLACGADSRGLNLGGQACRWGAAITAIAASSLRGAMAVVELALAIASGVFVGTWVGLSAGLAQCCVSQESEVIDCASSITSFFAA